MYDEITHRACAVAGHFLKLIFLKKAFPGLPVNTHGLTVTFQSTRLAQVPDPPERQGGWENPDGHAADPRPGSQGLSLFLFCHWAPTHSCSLEARKPPRHQTHPPLSWALLVAPSSLNAAVWLGDHAWLGAGFGARWPCVCFHCTEKL